MSEEVAPAKVQRLIDSLRSRSLTGCRSPDVTEESPVDIEERVAPPGGPVLAFDASAPDVSVFGRLAASRWLFLVADVRLAIQGRVTCRVSQQRGTTA